MIKSYSLSMLDAFYFKVIKIVLKFCCIQNVIQYILTYLRNRKHVPCFYQVIETRVKVWENEKCGSCFHSFFEFSQTFYNSIETRRTCLLFLLENTAIHNTQKRHTHTKKINLFTSAIKM